ncbi:hypothetical protein [Pseudogracilibacillus sp. SO30301A]|uniref:hypothetical protein n=1 Tax=Pseudogracilibacillus sp. SO30301A TaxID=3098291 RepID=UPI00300DFF69
MEDLFFAGFFLGMMAFAGLFIIAGIVLFILQAIGLFNIAKKEGRGDIAWLAWIPIVSQFLLTYLVEKHVHEGLRGKVTLLYGIAIAVSVFFGYFLPFVFFIPIAVLCYALYFIAELYSDNPLFHTALALVSIGCSIPIQIFMFRKNTKPLVNESVGEGT